MTRVDVLAVPCKVSLLVLSAFCGLAGCSGGSPKAQDAPSPSRTPSASPRPSPSADDSAALRRAVNAYSVAYLSGDAGGAYSLLSMRCQARITQAQMTTATTAAKATYGQQPIKSLRVDALAGDLARVTYTYSVPAINQSKEPWVREGGQWREDDC